MNKKNLIKIIILTFLLLILFLIGYFYFDNSEKDTKIYDDTVIIDNVFSDESIDNIDGIVENYRKEYNNQDIVGEISILNTDYKKAILQGNDNDYYLNHTEDKTSSYMGAIYLDFRVDIDDGRKLLIYGHNSASITMPFKILEEYYDYDYYKNHKYIKIITDNKIRLYKIYSVFVEVEDFSYMQTDFNNDDEWYQHISNFKNKSMYDTSVDVSSSDNILILQTCSTYYKYNNYDRKFLLIVAKEVSDK